MISKPNKTFDFLYSETFENQSGADTYRICVCSWPVFQGLLKTPYNYIFRLLYIVIYAYVYICTYIHICMWSSVSMVIYIYIYIELYIVIYSYVYQYIHIYIYHEAYLGSPNERIACQACYRPKRSGGRAQ